MSSTFEKKYDYHLKVWKKDNTRVIALLIFYENRNTVIFKVLGSVIYWIMYNYLCVDYMCSRQGLLSSAHKVFEKTTFNDISGIGIQELLMKIMYYHGFVKDKKATVTLKCRRKLVPYHPSRGFVILENN